MPRLEDLVPNSRWFRRNSAGTVAAQTDTELAQMVAASGLVSVPATTQPLDADLTAIAALATTAYGRALLTLANAAALAAAIPAATDALKGAVELATATETVTGTDATRAVTPLGMASAAQPRQGVKLDASDAILSSAPSGLTGNVEVIIEQVPNAGTWAASNAAGGSRGIIGDRLAGGWSILQLNAAVYFQYIRDSDGVNQQQAVALNMALMDAARFVRFRLDVTGAACTVGRSDDGVTWVDASTPTLAAGTIRTTGANTLRVGAGALAGAGSSAFSAVRRVEVRNGFGGTIVTEWKADHVGDSGVYTDTTGKVWYLSGTTWKWIDPQLKVIGAPLATTGLTTLVRTGVRSWEGTGSPEGVVTAPIGWRYVDRVATNGAVEWVKATGTGNTGWRVVFGDTGWRKVASWTAGVQDAANQIGTIDLTQWSIGAGAADITLRRVGDQVAVKFRRFFSGGAYLSKTNTGWANVFTTADVMPAGFQPGAATNNDRATSVASITAAGVTVGFGTDNVNRVLPFAVYAPAGTVMYGALFEYPTTAAWPTVLPGVAA